MEIPSSIFGEIVGRIDIGVYALSLEKKVVYWNYGAEQVTGYLEQEVLGRELREDLLVESDEHNLLLCVHACPLETARGSRPQRTLTYVRHRAGHVVPVMMWTVSVKSEDGQIAGSMKIFTEQLTAQEPHCTGSWLCSAENRDTETELPDRASMEAFLRAQGQLSALRKVPCGVIAVQLPIEHFCHSYGRAAGVALLREVSRTLQEMVRGTDLLGRWADDSFMAVLPDCGPEVLERVAARMKRVSSRVAIPWMGDRLSTAVEVRTILVAPGDSLETMVSRLFPSENSFTETRPRPTTGA